MAHTAPGYYNPVASKVAIVPAAIATGETWTDLVLKQAGAVTGEMQALFMERGFQVIPATAVQPVMGSMNLNLLIPAQRTTANFVNLGRRLGADLVAVTVVTSSTQGTKSKGLYRKSNDAVVTVNTWLVDTKTGQPIIAGQAFQGKQSAPRVSGEKGSDLQVISAVKATDAGFLPFTAGYPVVKQVPRPQAPAR